MFISKQSLTHILETIENHEYMFARLKDRITKLEKQYDANVHFYIPPSNVSSTTTKRQERRIKEMKK
jgi:predicted patatin/cPLA2 family phospholipase